MKRRLWMTVAAASLWATLVLTVAAQEPATVPPPAAPATAAAPDSLITEQLVRPWLEHLAADDLHGRAAGSEDMIRASQYVADQFKEMGLKPAASDGGWFQEFQHGRRRVAWAGTRCQVTMAAGDQPVERRLALDQAFQPFQFSAEGGPEGEVVFAGYGITAPEHKYDDYEGLDVKGKIVLVMRYEPGEKDAKSPFDGLEQTRHATFAAKMANAEKHGAAAIVMFTGPHYHQDEGDELYGGTSAVGGDKVGIPALQITRPAATELLASCGKDAAKVQEEIDAGARPQSFAIAGSRIKAAVAFNSEPSKLRNVLAVLPGSDERLADETIIIGAHLDHIGQRAADPKKPDRDTVFNGADDNASGVAGLLAVAKALTASGVHPRRTVFFMTFDGEEIGLVGSQYYATHPVRPLEKTALMINLDMLGRVQARRLMVLGVGSGSGLKDVVERAGQDLPLELTLGQSATAPSDSASFEPRRVPSLFLNCGFHFDMHRESDEASRINYAGLVASARLAARVALAVADADVRPAFTSPRRDAVADGPVMGVSVAADEQGSLVVQQVAADSGAAKAGLQPGDVIRTIDDKAVASMQALFELIRGHKIGDQVKVKLVHQGQEATVTVTLGARRG